MDDLWEYPALNKEALGLGVVSASGANSLNF